MVDNVSPRTGQTTKNMKSTSSGRFDLYKNTSVHILGLER